MMQNWTQVADGLVVFTSTLPITLKSELESFVSTHRQIRHPYIITIISSWRQVLQSWNLSQPKVVYLQQLRLLQIDQLPGICWQPLGVRLHDLGIDFLRWSQINSADRFLCLSLSLSLPSQKSSCDHFALKKSSWRILTSTVLTSDIVDRFSRHIQVHPL